MDPPLPVLHYTFGNHMHWADMQWLWGWEVLPGSLRDMIELCRAAEVRGNLNWDACALDRLAAEHPGALAELRQAVSDGWIDPVGGSWGQPYGQFHGGESNLRQFEFGLRANLRHLGVRPRIFWEEEFWMHPQMPQMLDQCGFEGACLFFQWTWHTPEVPQEELPLVRWRGVDGSELPAFTRNDLNLHQWPEDFSVVDLLGMKQPADDAGAEGNEAPRIVVQWLELMPSPDWMCRSELILPKLQEWRQDPRFQLRSDTLRGLLPILDSSSAPARTYSQDDLWHGMSLGKNGDLLPRACLRVERELLQAEALATLTSLLGRPYPSWGVYPVWELDEAWRELLAAQHHDNHECEGLCGFIGKDSLDKASTMACRIRERSLRLLARRLHRAQPQAEAVVVNALGWDRDVDVPGSGTAAAVPAFGYRCMGPNDWLQAQPVAAEIDAGVGRLQREGLRLEWSGSKRRLSWGTPHPASSKPDSLGVELSLVRDRQQVDLLQQVRSSVRQPTQDQAAALQLRADHPSGDVLRMNWKLHPRLPVVEWMLELSHASPPDPGMNYGVRLELQMPSMPTAVQADFPYGWSEIQALADRRRKYPSGDWMTSEQWFETVHRPFTSLRWVQWDHPVAPMLWIHDGAQSWCRLEQGIAVLLNLKDPWDEEFWHPRCEARLWQVLEPPASPEQRERLVDELLQEPLWSPLPPPALATNACVGGGSLDHREELPAMLPGLRHSGSGRITSLRRADAREGQELLAWAGHSMKHPWVLRLVETAGRGGEAMLRLPPPIRRAWRCNALGEAIQEMACHDGEIRLTLDAHQILTLMVDVPASAAQPRDLDHKREVWATIHRPGPT